MMKRYVLLALLVGVALSSCKKEVDYEAIDLGYDYFPNQVGAFIDYRVDSIHYGTTVDTVMYFLREVIADQFIDGEGSLATQVERYKKPNMQADYVLTDVWVQKRTPTTAERIEENERFVRLVFPLEAGKTWNGNAYNTREAWNYSYATPDQPYQAGPLTFPKTVRVNQRNNVNLVDQQIAWEVYASGFGLIYKYYKNLSFQNFEITGVDMEMVVIGYGVIE
jgi:hypothetical protein